MRALHWAALAASLAVACGEEAKKPTPPPAKGASIGDGSPAGDDPAAGGDAGGGGKPSPDQLIGADASFLRAKYSLSLRAGGVNACLGEILIRVKANAQPKADGSAGSSGLFEIQDGIIKCPGIGTFNLKEMLGAFQEQAAPPDVEKPVVVEENTIAMRVLQQGLYEPPRPLLPSFLATSPRDLKILDVTRTVKLTDAQTQKEAEGTVRVQTLSLDAWKPPKIDREFSKVLHFATTNEGFSGADKVAHFIFDRMEFRISLDPIAILSLSFEGRASDYTASLGKLGGGTGTSTATSTGTGTDTGAAGGLGGILGGGKDNPLGGVISAITKVMKIKLEMDLLDQQNLDESKTDTPENDGPIIGLRESSSRP